MLYGLATSTVVITAAVAVAVIVSAATAAAEDEDEDYNPRTIVTTKVTHLRKPPFCFHHILCCFTYGCYKTKKFKKVFDFS